MSSTSLLLNVRHDEHIPSKYCSTWHANPLPFLVQRILGEWVPLWLHKPPLFCTDCTKPRWPFHVYSVLHIGLFYGMLLGSIAAIVPLTLIMKHVDHHFCRDIEACVGSCITEADPDIVGIGVRVAIYIQSLCGVILLGFSPASRSITAVRSTVVLSSSSLILCGVVLMRQGKLSLAHAMVVVSLETVAILPLHWVEPWRVTNPALFFGQQLRLSLFMFMSVFLSLKVPCFGSDPQCNLCVRFGLGIFATHATNAISRSIRLQFACLTLTLWVNDLLWTYGPWNYIQTIPAIFLSTHRHQWQQVVKMTYTTLQDFHQRNNHPIWYWYYDDAKVGEHTRAWRRGTRFHRYGNAGTWEAELISQAWSVLCVPRCQRALIALVVIGQLILYIETTVKLNLSNKAGDWSFGQMYAIMLCIQPIAEVVQLFAGLNRHRRGRRMQTI